MSLVRPLAWTVLAAAGLTVAGTTAAGRQPPKDDLPPRPRNYGDVNTYRQAGIPADKLNEAKKTFLAFADYYGQLLAHPRVHTAPQEFRPDPPPKGSLPVPPTVDQIVRDIEQVLVVPEASGKVGPNEIDYVRELGVAFDTALGPLPRAGQQVVAVAGARALAAACQSGAAAHYKTVAALLTDPTVRPEAKYYVLQAAEHLLAAYDLNDQPAGFRGRRHSADPVSVGALIAAVQKAVEDPAVIFPFVAGPDGKPVPVPQDLVPAYQFIRRQAIRALAQVRFAEFSPAKGQTLYPAFALARVAMSDPALAVPPNPSEVAEAVIGIANMNPPRALGAEPYAYAMADAIATGLATFSGPKATKADDKSIAWKGYAGRLADALKRWQALFDANYTPQAPAAPPPGVVPPVATALAAEAERLVLGPLEAGSRPGADVLARQYRDATLRTDKNYTRAPFRDNPKLVLPGKN